MGRMLSEHHWTRFKMLSFAVHFSFQKKEVVKLWVLNQLFSGLPSTCSQAAAKKSFGDLKRRSSGKRNSQFMGWSLVVFLSMYVFLFLTYMCLQQVQDRDLCQCNHYIITSLLAAWIQNRVGVFRCFADVLEATAATYFGAVWLLGEENMSKIDMKLFQGDVSFFCICIAVAYEIMKHDIKSALAKAEKRGVCCHGLELVLCYDTD